MMWFGVEKLKVKVAGSVSAFFTCIRNCRFIIIIIIIIIINDCSPLLMHI